jgi:phage tail protein X
MAMTCRTAEGDMLDTICNNYYGNLRGTVEAVLSANEGLGREPQPFKSGLLIVLPDIVETKETTVRLWS